MSAPGHEGKARVQDWVTEAVRLDQAGRIADALACFRKAADLAPNHPLVLHNLSLALARNGDQGEAIEVARTVVRLHPNHAPATVHLAELLRMTGALDEAEAVLSQALGGRCGQGGERGVTRARWAQPAEAMLHNSLGLVWKAKGAIDRAAQHFAEARALEPRHREAGLNLAVALREQGDMAGARALHRAVLAEHPEDAAAHLAYAHSLLMAGDYASGWEEHEWRLRTPELAGKFSDLEGPRWDGGDLKGRRILVVAEQGYGDVIMFSRFLPEIQRRGGRAVLKCRRALHRLILQSGLVDEVMDAETVGGQRAADLQQRSAGSRQKLGGNAWGPNAEDGFACWVPLLSLPLVLGIGADTVRGEWAYLGEALDGEPACQGALGAKTRVGLVWRGNARPDPRRSIPTERLGPLASVAGIEFLCLQPDLPDGEVERARALGVGMEKWEGEDFAEAARGVQTCDLVMTIDTAMAHLAAAMGKPTWVLLPQGPDWRWGHEGARTPWYRSVRLFRQSSGADWTETMAEVARAVTVWNEARNRGSSFGRICR